MGVQELWKKEELALLRGFLKAPGGVPLVDQRLEAAGQLTLCLFVSTQSHNGILRIWHLLLDTLGTVSICYGLQPSRFCLEAKKQQGASMVLV